MIGASIHGLINESTDQTLNFSEIIQMNHDLLIMYGIEPNDTIYQAELIECMKSTNNLVVFTPYINEYFNQHADVIIPIKTHYEGTGSMINLELRNQSFNHIQSMSADEFSNIELLMSMYQGMGIQSLSVSEINDCIQKGIETIAITAEKISEIPDTTLTTFLPKKETIFNMYNTDNVLRRSKPLQNTKEGLSSK
tara:strand:- start:114801 stop:115385 length:585 start_codon:yes stop_codon:yes gene_type:complete